MKSAQEAAARDHTKAVAEQTAVATENNATEVEMNLLSWRGVRAPSGVNVTAEMQNILGAMPQPTSSRHIRSDALLVHIFQHSQKTTDNITSSLLML